MSELTQYIFYNKDIPFTIEELAVYVADGQASVSVYAATRNAIGQKIPFFSEWYVSERKIKLIPLSNELLITISETKYEEAGGLMDWHTGSIEHNSISENIAVVVLPPLNQNLKNKYLSFLHSEN